MFGAKRKRMMTDALKSTNNALDAIDPLRTLVIGRNAMSGRGIEVGQTFDEEERDQISLIVAHMMIARDNLMLAMGRSHPFGGIRSLYPPLEPEEATEFAEKVKKKLFG